MKYTLFKVGDKIKIRKDLSEEQSYDSSFGINDEMERLRGKTAVIIGRKEVKGEMDIIRKYRYYLDIDNDTWSWGIDMFDLNLNNNILELE